MPTDKSFGVVLVRIENGKPVVLLVKENPSALPGDRGYWGLPKGHPNLGETPEQTALRELKEETGITNCRLDTAHQWSIIYTVKNDDLIAEKTVQYFFGFTAQRDLFVDPKEIAACDWFSFDEAIKKATFDSVKEILQQAKLLVSSETNAI